MQLYADGFAACRSTRRCCSGTSTRRPWPVATSTTTSATAQPRDARFARDAGAARRGVARRCRRRAVGATPSCSGSTPARYNNLTARKFVLQLTPEALVAAAQATRPPPAHVPSASQGKRSTHLRGRLAPMFLDATVDPMVTTQDARAGRRHPARQRQQPLPRRDDGRPRGLRRGVSAQFAPGQDATARSSKRSTASAASTARHLGRIVLASRGRDSAVPRPRFGAALTALIAGTGPARKPSARLRHRVGAGQAIRPSTRSTASSRSTWTRAA